MAFSSGKLHAKAMGPGEAVFLFMSEPTPLSAPASRTSRAVRLTPAISKISRRRTPVHAHCRRLHSALHPSFAAHSRRARFPAHSTTAVNVVLRIADAVEVKFDWPLHRPANAQSPVSRIEVRRREMVSHEDSSVGINQSESDANGNSMFGGDSVERLDRVAVVSASSLSPFPRHNVGSRLREFRYNHTAPRSAHSSSGRVLAHTARSRDPTSNGQQRSRRRS